MNTQDSSTPLFSESVRTFLINRLEEAIGLSLIVIGLVFFALLITASPTDSTVYTITDSSHEVVNILNTAGAEIAAHFINAIGLLSSYALALVPLIWGLRLLRHRRPSRITRRIMLIPLALGFLAWGAATVLDLEYGGALGYILTVNISNNAWFNRVMPVPFDWFNYSYLINFFVVLLGAGFYLYSAALDITGVKQLSFLSLPIKSLWFGVVKLMRNLLTGSFNKLKESKQNQQKTTQRREPVLTPAVGHLGESAVNNSVSKQDEPVVSQPKKSISPTQERLETESQSGYLLPTLDYLTQPNKTLSAPKQEVLDANSRMLEEVLSEFGVRGEIEKARFGPVVTRYELSPAPGTKTQRVIGLADDIARSMSALSVRVSVVPGQNVIGIELPNDDRETVLIRDIFDHNNWQNRSMSLPIALGMDIAGHPVVVDLAKMPHLLVAGTTGSGKSVGINGLILSLLYTHTPETCRLIMIDPKMLELSVYDGIPHLLTPVVTDPGKAVTALKWTVREMEMRYRNMAKLGVRNIDGYNQRLKEARSKGEALARRVQTGFDAETGRPVFEEQELDLNPLPFIVVVIDEVADLMLVAGKDIEAAVQRLAQMARAAGIHVVMATQRPSVDVITGTIKANFPTRISFQVTSKIDSRTILGEQGAEQLLGRGDMLYMEGGGRIIRVHGPFVGDQEVEDVAVFLRSQGEPVYDDSVTIEDEAEPTGASTTKDDSDEAGSLYDQAVALVQREGKASTSFVQRHLRIGYNRAATIIEEMERNGVISKANHAGKREILINDEQ